MKHKLFISKISATLLSFFMAAFGAFASDSIPAGDTLVIDTPAKILYDGEDFHVRELKPFTVNSIENYFKDTTLTRSFMALKTNLLFDLCAMPNVELEIPLGRHFSIQGEYMFPWWYDKYTGNCLQILSGGLELRYWFDLLKKDYLHGQFLGVYGGTGLFDLGKKDGGFRGEGYMNVGLTYGYGFKLNNFLRLEASFGVGYIEAEYDHYVVTENPDYTRWDYSGKFTYIGPTKLKISLVLLLNCRDRKN